MVILDLSKVDRKAQGPLELVSYLFPFGTLEENQEFQKSKENFEINISNFKNPREISKSVRKSLKVDGFE